MATLLEQTRASHEEMEKLERIIVKDFQQEIKSHKQRLFQGHRVSQRLDAIQTAAGKLRKIYDDKDNSRRDEIAAIGGQNVFSAFYERLKEAREYHRRFPSAGLTEAREEPEEQVKAEPRIEFSGEEGVGRYLDLHVFYHEFVNSSFGRPMEYLEFVQQLDEFSNIPRQHRMTKAYSEYLEKLCEYMKGFHERTQPLTYLPTILEKLESDFEEAWEGQQVPGWEDKGCGVEGHVDSTVDLEGYESAQQLLDTIDADSLKSTLTSLGLKCGGTPQQRAERLFATKGVPLESLPKKWFVSGAVPASLATEEQAQKQQAKGKQVALLEARVSGMVSQLAEAIRNTADNVEKKLVRTTDERLEEVEEEEDYMENDSDEEDEIIYNPLKLPLGWDGKPIPYWLYKLHGLNQEFKCEICGNESYWGRRAYERHFREARHQHGMRCLKVPNTKAFLEVTKIEDAVALAKHVEDIKELSWNPEEQEEHEDQDGNVYSKKTFQDLRRQGLI